MRTIVLIPALLFVAMASPAVAQAPPFTDPVLERIWRMGMEESRAHLIAQPLIDSIGPRLTGAPAMEWANDWAVELIRSWDVQARKEQYGTWLGWDRGITHIDLIEPRVRSLEGRLLAWSPGSGGTLEGPVVVLPDHRGPAEFESWLGSVAGRFVAISFPQPTCRPDADFLQYGTSGALDRLRTERDRAFAAFRARYPSTPALRTILEQAGALGILESNWANGPGVTRVHSTNTTRIPTVDLSCEDYGLIWRLADNGQGPVVRLEADAEFLGEVSVHNTIAEIRGRELPEEYVVLSAHFDSWDAASGATDNGSGSTVMLEALRILAEVYPQPKRTILLGLWGGEEQGLNGSRRFAAMHPEVVTGMQALFNQDTGTGRVSGISAQGLLGAGAHLADWLSRIPREITQHIELSAPDLPSAGSSDHAAFICSGAPAFHLTSVDWGYGLYTWHTNRDTYDKIVFEELRSNAVLIAMLVYLASEDPQRLPRERREMPLGPQGEPQQWPVCQPGRTAW
jgi:carboxypeptidase Q